MKPYPEHDSKYTRNKSRRQETKSKLFTLGFVLILSALILSGCGSTAAESTETPTETEVEYCSDKNTGAKLSYQEAVEIAQNSECLEQGQLKETRVCNEGTGTWWIDLDIDKPGCMPACVINLSDRAAEINWRCTGVLPPDDTVEIPEGVQSARDAVLAYLNEHYGEKAPALGLTWTGGSTLPENPPPGWSEYQFTSDDWVIKIGHAVLPPEQIIYEVVVTNQTTGFHWQGEVDAAWRVTEKVAPTGG
jgi:hypothetical protein